MGWTVYNSDGQILQGSAALDDGSITNAKLATSAITGAPDLGGAPATDDTLLISDTNASAALKEITVDNIFTAPSISGNATAATQAGTDDSTRIATTAHVKDVKIDDLTAGDDNTDLDSSAARHGLLRKLDGTTTNFLRGDGAWAAASSTPTSTWIPTHAMRSTTAESVNHWDYAALYMDASNTDTICVSGVFAATPTAVKWIIMPTLASGSIVYTLTSDYASVGQTLQTHQDSTGNTTLPTTNNTLQALDVMISPNNFFGSAVAGDFFGMIFSRIGGNGSDTLNATLAVIGLLVEY